jgi:nitrite reductase (NO-forming)
MVISYIIFKVLGAALATVSLGFLVIASKKARPAKWERPRWIAGLVAGLLIFAFSATPLPSVIGYPFLAKTYGPSIGPSLPLKMVAEFFAHLQKFDQVTDIAADPSSVPPPIERTEPQVVKIDLTAKEVLAEVAPGVMLNYWTFNGQVPGPMLRVREGDTVELTLHNDASSLHTHSIDLHAVTGPGGGAAVMQVAPGASKSFRFLARNPGLFVYHCASPNVAVHNSHGQYGMILVEPKGGLPKVDREYYVMQGELYTQGRLGERGLQAFDAGKMLDGHPEYVVFNGRVNGTVGNMKAKRGERIRIFFGNGGVNLVSSFHAIGEVFDDVFPEASMGGDLHHNVQTTLVPAGGATIVEMGLEVPGKLILVDHALARLDRGAWGTIQVDGDPNPEVFQALSPQEPGSMGGH